MATMDDTTQAQPRFFHLTPGRFVLLLLAIEVLLWASERVGWPGWHKGYAVLTCVGAVGVAMLLMLGWFAVASVFGWRFQFSVRMLLVLVVAVALPFSWLAVERKRVREQRDAIHKLQELGVFVRYSRNSNNSKPDRIPGANWLRGLLGDDFFTAAGSAYITNDSELRFLEGVPQLEELSFRGTDVTDIGLQYCRLPKKLSTLQLWDTGATDAVMEHIRGLTWLKTLYVSGPHVTDSGLLYVEGLIQLQGVYLKGPRFTGTGLVHLNGLRELDWLSLHGENINDDSLGYLRGLSQLRSLNLEGTKVTDAGVAKLQKALPDCKITR